MNKIVLDNEIITNTDSNINFNNNNIIIKNDTDLRIDVNKNSKINVEISDDNKLNLFILINNSTIDLNINELENSKCDLSIFGINVNGNVKVHLKGVNSKLQMYNSELNSRENKICVDIYHDEKKTTSSIYNHGCNYNNGILEYLVNGIVPKNSSSCVCNQDNKIINLSNNICNIHPNLLIDNYDVIANHSAYIGSFKEEVLFYLKSRGIPKKECYELLLKAYLVGDMNISNDLKNELLLLINKYGGELFE